MITSREIDPVEARIVWRDAEPFLREAVEDTDPEQFIRNLKAKIFAGLNTLWEVRDDAGEPIAYAVTVIYTHDGILNTAQIYMGTAKSLELFVSQMDQFEAWAIQRDVDVLEVVGRKGWERVLKPWGFSHNYTSLTKRVARELH